MYSGIVLGLLAFVAIIPVQEVATASTPLTPCTADGDCSGVSGNICCKLTATGPGVCTPAATCCGMGTGITAGTCTGTNKCCALTGLCLANLDTCGLSSTQCVASCQCTQPGLDTCCKTSKEMTAPGVCTAKTSCCGYIDGVKTTGACTDLTNNKCCTNAGVCLSTDCVDNKCTKTCGGGTQCCQLLKLLLGVYIPSTLYACVSVCASL